MFKSCIEEPVTNNQYLHQRADTSFRSILLDSSSGLQLNRYTFEATEYESEAATVLLLTALTQQLGDSLWCVAAWMRQVPTRSIVAGLAVKKNYEKAEWQTTDRETHFLAYRSLDAEHIQRWPPLEMYRFSGMIMLLGPNQPESVIEHLDHKTSYYLAEERRMIPHQHFLQSLENSDVSLIYQRNTDMNHLGLVLVTSKKLDLSVPELENVMMVTS